MHRPSLLRPTQVLLHALIALFLLAAFASADAVGRDRRVPPASAQPG